MTDEILTMMKRRQKKECQGTAQNIGLYKEIRNKCSQAKEECAEIERESS